LLTSLHTRIHTPQQHYHSGSLANGLAGHTAEILAEFTEFPAVFEGVRALQTDGEGGGVHVGAVCQRHLVCACLWRDVRAMLVTVVIAVVVAVTDVGLRHTSTTVTSELVRAAGTV